MVSSSSREVIILNNISTERVQEGNLLVAKTLHDFITNEALPGLSITSRNFWSAFENIIDEMTPVNRELLAKRDKLQGQLDKWYKERAGSEYSFNEYQNFLSEIGYLEPECDDFKIGTSNIDKEIAEVAAPQLVVPVTNERYVLNAANARWRSLYDALYGSDVISEDGGCEKGNSYNALRGRGVIKFGREFLDQAFPLDGVSHNDVVAYCVESDNMVAVFPDGKKAFLKVKNQFIGFLGDKKTPSNVLLLNNGLHVEIKIDSKSLIGKADKANITDIIMESAVTTIVDFEDSVVVVDEKDKTHAYRNWLGLMIGDLSKDLFKSDKVITRTLNPDRVYISPKNNKEFTLHGRSLLFVRHTGHLMFSRIILDKNRNAIPEGVMDGVILSLISLHDLKGNGKFRNSRNDSIYIVKPKMHGSAEVAFTNHLFSRIEDSMQMQRNTLKIGVMDEERRTTVNLKNCIREVKDRIVFVNTGFLDRTGDEIHTSMEKGVFFPKVALKSSAFMTAYEQWNVDTALSVGMQGKGQIGKGMWAMPDKMELMLKEKKAHLLGGASTSWVPSPTAATLHAIHYHQVSVNDVQKDLLSRNHVNIEQLLTVPVLASDERIDDEIVQAEIDNNIQGLLGYVIRWINLGVGCSTIPDRQNVGLMEDRATLRISSQHLANWIHHGVCTRQQVQGSLDRLVLMADKQNKGDIDYVSMLPEYNSNIAFKAVLDLIFKGRVQPSGYTDVILYERRCEAKLLVTE